ARESRDSPRLKAFWRVAPSVRFNVLECSTPSSSFWLPFSTHEHQLLTTGDALLSLPYKNSMLGRMRRKHFEPLKHPIALGKGLVMAKIAVHVARKSCLAGRDLSGRAFPHRTHVAPMSCLSRRESSDRGFRPRPLHRGWGRFVHFPYL